MRAAVAFIAAAAAMTNAASLKEKPIVGILSQPLSEDDDRPCAFLSPPSSPLPRPMRRFPAAHSPTRQNDAL